MFCVTAPKLFYSILLLDDNWFAHIVGIIVLRKSFNRQGPIIKTFLLIIYSLKLFAEAILFFSCLSFILPWLLKRFKNFDNFLFSHETLISWLHSYFHERWALSLKYRFINRLGIITGEVLLLRYSICRFASIFIHTYRFSFFEVYYSAGYDNSRLW